MRVRIGALFMVLGGLLLSRPGTASETDQLTERNTELAALPDSLEALDGWMNERLDAAAKRLNRRSRQKRLVELNPVLVASSLFVGPVAKEMFSKIEVWIQADPRSVPRLELDMSRGIYAGTELLDARFTLIVGLASTIKVDGVLMGTDKLGHFLSQGYSYNELYRRLPADLPEEEKLDRLRELGHEMEVGPLGLATDGVYSPADQAANWAGFRFWQRLVDGPEPYLVEGPSGWVRARDFSFAPYVNDDWDEALNPPFMLDQGMADTVQANVDARCVALGERGLYGTGRREPERYRASLPVDGVRLRPACEDRL